MVDFGLSSIGLAESSKEISFEYSNRLESIDKDFEIKRLKQSFDMNK
jgi:hypothetical protein